METLINDLQFDQLNPFDFADDIFSSGLKKFPKSFQDDFIQKFYQHWITWSLQGEIDTTIVYPMILKKIQDQSYDQYFSDEGSNDKETVIRYFQKMIVDENEHADHFTHLIQAIYHDDSLIPTKSAQGINEAKVIQSISSKSLEELLLLYYTGECYLWTAFYLIYKQTQNANKKKLFHKLLVEESQHNNNIYKTFKRIRPAVNVSKEMYIKMINNFRFFGLDFVITHFKLADSSLEKQKHFIQLIYDSPWHHRFNHLVIKKWYQLFSLLFPEVSLNEFASIVNAHESHWLPVAK